MKHKAYRIENNKEHNWFSKLNILEGIKNYHGVNDILNHYHVWCDTYLGIGIYAIRIMTCDCIECINSINL